MRIIDKTPYRSENGEISFIDRIQASLKYGSSWYGRVQAQEQIIPSMEKSLGNSFTLLRNITLPGTEITLPLVLAGPAGIFLINALSEKGVYRAKDNEWGTISGDHFAPARLNQVQLTLRMARVLQVYLDRQGFAGTVSVEPVMMAPDPALHVDSVRPSVRIVMSDAIERFAVSLNQNQSFLGGDLIGKVVRSITEGLPQRPPPQQATQDQGETIQTQSDAYQSRLETPDQVKAQPFTSSLDLNSGDPPKTGQSGANQQSSSTGPDLAMPPVTFTNPKRARFLGLTNSQIAILVGMLLCIVCITIIFIFYVVSNLNV